MLKILFPDLRGNLVRNLSEVNLQNPTGTSNVIRNALDLLTRLPHSLCQGEQ
jgi:hypothetical protein